MNYEQTIDYLYSQLPMFSRMGSAAYKKDLTNTILLCEKLGNPQRQFKSIHVGGTNGKGSVSHMLAASLHQSGYKTGLYTSPHLYDFRERIRINGEMVEESFVIDFVEKIKVEIETIRPSFFEITVAMAFSYFAEKQVDVAVIEVGLGGRLDSTNIITPEVSVITNIGWDHANMLGNTLPEIAFEKAGIIKEGVPAVMGEKQEETAMVFTNKAREVNAPLSFASDHFKIADHHWENGLLELSVINDQEVKEEYSLDLPGIYQLKNICTFLETKRQLEKLGWHLPIEEVKFGLKNVKKLTGLAGRWEVIHENPRIILEVAHNKDGIEQMMQHIEQMPYNKLHFILGMVKDKDLDMVLPLFPSAARYYFTQAHIPRAVPAAELCVKANSFGLKGEYFDDVNKALKVAKHQAEAGDLIVVCGSIFLVAEVCKDF